MRGLIPWTIFISGRGSNLQTALDLDDRIYIDTVISSKASALGLMKARRFGVPARAQFSKSSSWDELNRYLQNRKVRKIFLLGFMRLIPEGFLRFWEAKIYNVHPSLLPLHPGLHGLEQGWQQQSPLGVSVHHVTAEMDAGSLIYQGSYSRQNCDEEKVVRRNAWMERRLVSEVLCR